MIRPLITALRTSWQVLAKPPVLGRPKGSRDQQPRGRSLLNNAAPSESMIIDCSTAGAPFSSPHTPVPPVHPTTMPGRSPHTDTPSGAVIDFLWSVACCTEAAAADDEVGRGDGTDPFSADWAHW